MHKCRLQLCQTVQSATHSQIMSMCDHLTAVYGSNDHIFNCSTKWQEKHKIQTFSSDTSAQYNMNSCKWILCNLNKVTNTMAHLYSVTHSTKHWTKHVKDTATNWQPQSAEKLLIIWHTSSKPTNKLHSQKQDNNCNWHLRNLQTKWHSPNRNLDYQHQLC